MERRIFLTTAFLLGLLAFKWSPAGVVFALSSLCLVMLWRPSLCHSRVVLLLVICFWGGWLRCWVDCREETPSLKGLVKVHGYLLDSPRRWGSATVFFFRVNQLGQEPVDRPFTLLVRWSGCEQSPAPGDNWYLEGRFTHGKGPAYPGGFDEASWLWTQGACGVLQLNRYNATHYMSPPLGYSPRMLACRLRARMMGVLDQIEHKEARALIAGVVFGETQSLPDHLQEQFRRTGTSHLLAASGMNVALLAGLILGAGKLCGLGPWRLAPLAMPAVIGYAFLAGCAPSITRAATGTTLALLAMWMGRTTNPWNSLCLSVWLLLLWDPRQIYDLGFQLSVAAVVGLVGGPDPEEDWGYLKKSSFLTWTASLITLPIFWHAFGTISTTLLIANLILGPLVELLFPLGLLVTLTGARPLLLFSEYLARFNLWLVGRLSEIANPLELTPPPAPSWLLVGLALLAWMKGARWSVRCSSIALVLVSLSWAYHQGCKPSVPPGVIHIRRTAPPGSIVWVSSHQSERLYIEKEWQTERALSMTRKLGCLRPVEVVCGEREIPIREGFQWSQLSPYLPQGCYLEVWVEGDGYRFREGG